MVLFLHYLKIYYPQIYNNFIRFVAPYKNFMAILPSTIRFLFQNRLRNIDRMREHGDRMQQQQLQQLVGIPHGKSHGIKYLDDLGFSFRGGNYQELYREFTGRVPIVNYDQLAPYVVKIQHGEQGILSHKKVKWMAKSSGTTASVSKFIPITTDALHKCHFQGGRDVMAIHCDNFPDSKAFNGKALTLGGSASISEGGGIMCGDLSAIMIANTPMWVNTFRYPKADIALISDFEHKVQEICRCSVSERITSFAGVPSWNMVLMNKILEHTGASNMHEVWPDMSLFIHGGVGFKPYREPFAKLFPESGMRYMETYNASEGFFAIQDDPSRDDMLLMLDYGVFYEFLELGDYYSGLGNGSNHDRAVPLEGVRCGVNYAMIITTNGGLWRYMIGDTVEFTSIKPYKIRITGRTKQFINVFGEEVIVDNAERALQATCAEYGGIVSDYTVAPVFMEGREQGAHEWLIEFSQMPHVDLALFCTRLDAALRALNSDYNAKRQHGSTLRELRVTVAPKGTFLRWFDSRGKVGGQNKVPRLSNSREYIEQLLAVISH